MYQFLFSALFFWSQLAGAVNVNPGEKLGSIKVTLPDVAALAPLSAKFKKENVSISITINKVTTALNFDKVSAIAANEGCLQVAYSVDQISYKAVQCGIKIEEKKLTTIPLTALKLFWDQTQIATELGPQPTFILKATDAQASITMQPFSPAEKWNQDMLYILPAMNVSVELSHEQVGMIYQNIVSLKPGQIEQSIVNIKKDIRATLFIDFVDGAPTYDVGQAANYVVANFRTAPAGQHYPDVSDRLWYFSSGFSVNNGSPDDWNGIINWYKFQLSGQSQKILAYPLANANDFYEVNVNEQIVPVTLTAGKETRIPVATVNVNDYKSGLPGTFKLFTEDTAGFTEAKFASTNNPTGFMKKEFNTKSSLFLPYGRIYRLDFFISDATLTKSLQDQVTLDLTKE
jgi:hypothetical protein